ncbi:MAG: SH3 domain-containing protein [Gammaproteobacteria bacterium]|nr:SH3 domain-containing protein [Gammaproteobacteria bacterium]
MMVMRLHILLIILLQCSVLYSVHAEDNKQKVVVADPFLEVHTGPSTGYPIFHVVERGEAIEVIKRYTSWYLIKTKKNKEGWVHSSQLVKTLTLDGSQVEIKDITRENYLEHTGELGILIGTFQSLSMMTFYTDYSLTHNLSVELSLAQILGNFSSRLLLGAEIVHQPFPDWKISPYFSIGTGIVKTSVRSTLSQLKDSTDNTANVSLGFKMYLTRRFILRADVKKHIIFQSRNYNEEVTSWQAGFAFFF